MPKQEKRRYSRCKGVLFCIAALLVGILLFYLGEMDDAPGLSFIGLLLAFLLVMRGLCYFRVISVGYAVPVVLLVFGVVACFFPIVLLWDGELAKITALFWIAETVGFGLLLLGVLGIRRNRRKRRTVS